MATTGTTPYYGFDYATPDTAVADFPAVSKQQAEKSEAILKTANVPPGNPDVTDILLRLAAAEAQLAVVNPQARPISPGTNLDDIGLGLWGQTASASARLELNYPAAVAGLLENFAAAGIMQWQRYTSFSTTVIVVYTRSRYSSAWGAWKKLTPTAV